MSQSHVSRLVRHLTIAAALTAVTAIPARAQSDIVLHAANATTVLGDWQQVADATAAAGRRMWNPDRGAGKQRSASANPYDYFELTFTAQAGRGYRLWIRGRAENDSWSNDSVFVQFSGSVHASGGAAYRIGTTDATVLSIEEGGGAGLRGWGWEDNGYDGAGPLIYFAATGSQTIRISRREDGLSIDQVVLSATTYLSAPPGARKSDTTILAATAGSSTETSDPVSSPSSTTSSSTEIVIPVAASAALRGAWQTVADTTAAGGVRVWNPDRGAAKLSSAAASPTDYFDVTFTADAGRAYRLWIRGRADNDAWTNDSVFVQFSGSVSATGSRIYRIGTTDAATMSVEACSGCGLSKWGWEDNGYGTSGQLVYFASTGSQTLRIQRREDGISIDQIVLSASQYLTAAPGAAKNDTTILTGAAAPAPDPEPEPEPEPAPPPPTGSPVKLRVMEWNIHHGVGTDNVYNTDRLATWMAKMNPHVILLNEVEKYTSWGYEDQPARFKAMLEAKTGQRWYSHFVQEFGAWSANGKGHQILSVYPFDAVGQSIITQSSGLNGAGAAAQATITVNGRTINLVLSHLDPYDQAMRLIQAKDVIRLASSYAENRIIAGDMNAWPDQSSILEINKTYIDSWTAAVNKGTATAPSGITPFGATKKGRIDYIFVSKNAANVVVLSSTVPDTRDAKGIMPSDHRPVMTTFEVR